MKFLFVLHRNARKHQSQCLQMHVINTHSFSTRSTRVCLIIITILGARVDEQLALNTRDLPAKGDSLRSLSFLCPWTFQKQTCTALKGRYCSGWFDSALSENVLRNHYSWLWHALVTFQQLRSKVGNISLGFIRQSGHIIGIRWLWK